MKITSNDDDSVTLEVDGVVAEISADSWKDANNAAHILGSYLQARADVSSVVSKIRWISELAKSLETQLTTAERMSTELLSVLEKSSK